MADFKNRDEIKAWLQTQPRDVCTVFAARAALRVAPMFSNLLNNKNFKKSPTDIILPSLWATATALSAGNLPDRAVVLAAAYAAYAATATAATAAATTATATATATAATAYAAYAAYAAADADAAADAATAAADADADADADAKIYHVFSKDLDFMDNGGTARTLSEQPLWPNRDIPTRLNLHWKKLKDHLLNRDGEEWHVWIDWYEDRLIGKPLIEEIEIGDPENGQYGRVTFPPNDYKDPAIINPKIKAMLADYWARQRIPDKINVSAIEEIVDATPLAETINISVDGKFDVHFLPVRDLIAQNLNRLSDAVSNAKSANGLNEHSPEIKFVEEIISEHNNDPQRIFDDCTFIEGHIQSKISKDFLDGDSFEIARLVDALNQTTADIRAYEAEVRNVIETRRGTSINFKNLHEETTIETLNGHSDATKEILSDNLNAHINSDVNDVLAIAGIKDRGQAAYRLLSRYSRIYMEIRTAHIERTLSDSTLLAFTQVQPHIESLLVLLKPVLTII